MTATQTSLLPPTPGEEREFETDTAERGDDPTPRGVIRAALSAALMTKQAAAPDVRGFGAIRVLDVFAGYGAWASEIRRLALDEGWPVHITGVEIHEPRREHLRKWCDNVQIRDAMTWDLSDGAGTAVMGPPGNRWDLVIGNPAFELLTGPKGAKLPPEQCMPAVLLRHAPAVLLLHTQQAFLKSEAGRASWRWSPPAASWLVPGGVSFRGPGKGSDSTCYQVTLWLRDHTGPCSVYMLDDLPPSARSWTVPPGTEEPSTCPELTCPYLDGPRKYSPPCVCGGTGLDPNGDLPSAPGYSS